MDKLSIDKWQFGNKITYQVSYAYSGGIEVPALNETEQKLMELFFEMIARKYKE